jgi:hypothetical protein
MYAPRQRSALTPTAGTVADCGIAIVDDIYSVNELAAINSVMTPLFRGRAAEARSYVRPDDMLEAGILDRIFSPAMRDVLLSMVPDPVLFHFHAYEIAGKSTRSHIFADQLGGWHRDPDSEYFAGDPTHISVFVYLSDVAEEDGAFEFSPHLPEEPLRSDSPVIKMTGPVGLSFVWHRSFYHRASPNRGPRRRRLLKISIQPNSFPSVHLGKDFFRRVKEGVPSGDVLMDMLLGRYQGQRAPRLEPRRAIRPERPEASRAIDVPEDVLAEMRRREKAEAGKEVAYD